MLILIDGHSCCIPAPFVREDIEVHWIYSPIEVIPIVGPRQPGFLQSHYINLATSSFVSALEYPHPVAS